MSDDIEELNRQIETMKNDIIDLFLALKDMIGDKTDDDIQRETSLSVLRCRRIIATRNRHAKKIAKWDVDVPTS